MNIDYYYSTNQTAFSEFALLVISALMDCYFYNIGYIFFLQILCVCDIKVCVWVILGWDYVNWFPYWEMTCK